MIITNEIFTAAAVGSTISGDILVKDYNVALTKTGKEYIVGTVQAGEVIQFKAWGNSSAFSKFKNQSLSGCIMNITGTKDGYGGMDSIVIEDISEGQETAISKFLETVYDVDTYWTSLIDLVRDNVSKKGFDLANKLLFENVELRERFCIEFAASHHHDSVKSGLLAHTYKVVYLSVVLLGLYPALTYKEGIRDIIVLGALFHDIGKTAEMYLGTYTEDAIVTHRYLGIEMLDRDAIVEAYGEHGWLEFVSIMLQHHGAYDDKCRTIASYIVHVADLMESRVMSVATDVKKLAGTDTKGKRVSIDDYKLAL